MIIFEGEGADDVWLAAAAAIARGDGRHQLGRLESTQELLHVAMIVRDPTMRWVTSRYPALNVAFALAEVVWIVNGRDEASFINFWNRRMPAFAGDTPTYPGAYGKRLRSHFGFDQLRRAADVLTRNPDGRQVVLQIWDPKVDLPGESGEPNNKDIPCNITSMLKVRDQRLEWFQVMRSNDLFLGLPHNLTQFLTLQEIVAGWIGIETGSYTQVSDSLHVYERDLENVAKAVRVKPARDGESLRFPYEVSMNAFRDLYERCSVLTAESIRPEDAMDAVLACESPLVFRNWMSILGAEASRRHGWADLAKDLAQRCTSPVLSQLWAAWLRRVEGVSGA